MTPLRTRMLEDMQLKGYSQRTQEAYSHAVRQLAAHFRRSPDQLTEEDLRQYFLYLTREKKVARATATIAMCGVKFFFQTTLHRDWTSLALLRPAREHRLPIVLTRDEVRDILLRVRIPVYRACLTTIYACGLRLLEGTQLKPSQIDGKLKLVHVHGKGSHDRYVPLPDATLVMLRDFWRTHRSPDWLFPAPSARRDPPTGSPSLRGCLARRRSRLLPRGRCPRLRARACGLYSPCISRLIGPRAACLTSWVRCV